MKRFVIYVAYVCFVEGNVSTADGFQIGQLPRELTNTDDVNESRPPPNFPAFEGLDLDLAEADFAPSHWNYEISSQENGRSDLKVATSIADKETVHVPDVEQLRNKSDMADESTEALKTTNQTVTSEVDVLSACLHTCVAEPDVPGMEEQLENRTHEEVATSPPDIVCSAPDVVSSAMVGVDVVPSSRTDSDDTLAKLNLNQDSKDLMEQAAEAQSTLESLDVILNKHDAESEVLESTDIQEEEKSECCDQLSEETLAQDLKTKSLESSYVRETDVSPAAAAAEMPSFCEDENKNLGIDLDGGTSFGISDTAAAIAECFDAENSTTEEITESAMTVDKSYPVTASSPPQENEKCNDTAENITSAFSPFPTLPSSCDTKAEVSSEEVASKPHIAAVLHKEVYEGSSLESSKVLDEAQPENEEICSAETIITEQAKTNSSEILVDQPASFESQAQLESTECRNSDSNESCKVQLENSETGLDICESEDLKEISEERGENEVISESEVHQSIAEKQSDKDVIASPEHSEITRIRDPGSVKKTEVMKMSLEDEKPVQKLHEDAEKLVREEKIETEILVVDKNETRNKTESNGKEPNELFDEAAKTTEELSKQSDDMLESADLSKEIANQEMMKILSAELAQKQSTFVGFGGAEPENDFTEEEMETYLREIDMNPDSKATDAKCIETLQKPGGDDNTSFKEELLSAENVKFPPKEGGPMETDEEEIKPSNLVYDAGVLGKASEFSVEDEKKLCSDELDQMDVLSSPSDSFMLVNGHGAEVDVGCDNSDVPVLVGNLADEQVESLMKEVEEEVRQMILDGETATDRDRDQTYSHSLDVGEADTNVVQSSTYADKSHEESFEDQAMFVVYGSEAKDGKGNLRDVLNSEASQSHVTPARLDLRDALLNEVEQSRTAVETGLKANTCDPHSFSTEDVATSDHSLPLSFDRRGEAPSNVPLNHDEDRPSPAGCHETQPPESASGARQKEIKAVKPASLDLAGSLQQPPATLAATSAEGLLTEAFFRDTICFHTAFLLLNSPLHQFRVFCEYMC